MQTPLSLEGGDMEEGIPYSLNSKTGLHVCDNVQQSLTGNRYYFSLKE